MVTYWVAKVKKKTFFIFYFYFNFFSFNFFTFFFLFFEVFKFLSKIVSDHAN